MRRVERKEEGRKGYCEKKMGESVQCGGTPYAHMDPSARAAHTAATLRPHRSYTVAILPAIPPATPGYGSYGEPWQAAQALHGRRRPEASHR